MLRRRVIVVAVLMVLVGLIAWPIVAHYRLKNAVARYARQLAAQGETLSVPELAPPLPPSEQNGAPAMLAALALLPPPNFSNRPPMMRHVAPGRALVAWREDPLPTADTTNVWPGLRNEVERRRATLARLRAALSKPALVVDVNYLQGFSLMLPHLAQMKSAALWLTSSTLLDLHERRADDAVVNLEAAVRLVARSKDEPLLISALVRLANSAIAGAATWELLQCPDVTEAHLAALQAEWESVELGSQVEAAFRMERAMFRELLAEMRSSRQSAVRAATTLQPTSTALDELKELAKTAVRNPGQGIREIAIRYPAYWAWRWWGSYRDELAAMQSAQAAIAAAQAAGRAKDFQAALASLDVANSQIQRRYPKAGSWFVSNPLELNRSILLRWRAAETQRALAVAAIALKRYERRHGRLPDTLEALVPEFCVALPRDPVDGQPLRYRRLPDGGFLLYSVGENGTDDGGDPTPARAAASLSMLRGRDAVWPQPATAQESWLYALEMELSRQDGQRATPRVVVTNGLPPHVLHTLERLRRVRFLVLTNQPATAR